MHAGKHQEYEKKLHEALQARLAAQSKQEQQPQEPATTKQQSTAKSKESPGSTNSNSSSSSCSSTASTTNSCTSSNGSSSTNSNNGNNNNNNNNGNSKETWPQLNSEKEKTEATKKTEKEKDKSRRNKTKSGSNNTNSNSSSSSSNNVINNNNNNNNISNDSCKKTEKLKSTSENNQKISGDTSNIIKIDRICKEQSCFISDSSRRESESSSESMTAPSLPCVGGMLPKLPLLDDNSSFFSQNTFHKISPSEVQAQQSGDDEMNAENGHGAQILNDSLPDINSCEDWEAAFGFSKHSNHLEELANTKDAFSNCYGALGMDGSYMDGFSGEFDCICVFISVFGK